MKRLMTLEIGSGENANLAFDLHNDIRGDQWHVELSGDCLDLDLPKESISLIKANQIYEHFERSDQIRLLRLCYRFLVKGGVIIIYTPDLDWVLKLGSDN